MLSSKTNIFLLTLSTLMNGCTVKGTLDLNANSAGFGVPNFSVNLPANFKSTSTSTAALRVAETLSDQTTVFNEIKCTDSNCQDGSAEGRGKEFGNMMLTPQLVSCIADKIWGLTADNFTQVTSFSWDLYKIATDPTYPCYEFNTGTNMQSSYLLNLKGRCWDLGSAHDSGYHYLCKAKNVDTDDTAFEFAFSVDSLSATTNYSGKGYVYSLNSGWFKWLVNAGQSAQVWAVKTDTSSGKNKWSNYCHAKDDYVTKLFTWNSMMGYDPDGDTGGPQDGIGNIEFHDGVYDYSSDYGKVRVLSYPYTASDHLNYGPTASSTINACFAANTSTLRISGACDFATTECDQISACTAIDTSSIPAALGTPDAPMVDYLKKFSTVDLSDGVNTGIRFEEKFSTFVIEG